MRVVVAEDLALLREGMARLLAEAGFEVVGLANDGQALIDLVERERPDVAIVDVRMPPTYTKEGLVAAERIQAEHPSVGVLVLSAHLEAHHAAKLLGRGRGAGYLLKESVIDPGEFLDAVGRVGSGGSAIDPELVRSLVGQPRTKSPVENLSEKEREVLALMAEGRSNGAIGQRLFMSKKTVEGHVSAIFTKLGLEATKDDNRRVLAVLEYLRA